MLRSTALGGLWAEDLTGLFSGASWTGPAAGSHAFYQLLVTPLGSNALLNASLLNKLAYGLRVPFTHAWIAQWSDPTPGDIVVLNSPKDGVRLVKRLGVLRPPTLAATLKILQAMFSP